MEIEMNQDDIAMGVKESSNYCPVANAIRRITGASTDVYLDGWVDIVGRGHWQIPHEVAAAIKIFDETGVMSPMKFELYRE